MTTTTVAACCANRQRVPSCCCCCWFVGLAAAPQALDNRPSLIKKLNEKMTGLEAELALLRDQTRVNELERKVQVRC